MHRRLWILLLCLVVLVAVAVLAASLHDVHFEPGRPFAVDARSVPSVSPPEIQALNETPTWKILLVWLVLVINLGVFLLLLPAELRKRLLRQIVSFAVAVLALLLAIRYRILQLPGLFLEPPMQGGAPLSDAGADLGVPVFHPPQVGPWLAYAISLVVLWIVFLCLWIAYRWWRKAGPGRRSVLDDIANIARDSLDSLAAGRQWNDVVIETYSRMSDVVIARRGLQRGISTTPREFAHRLIRAGLPADSVAGLTRLFESVRYGGRGSSEVEGKEAVAFLESILRACGVST